MIDSGTVYSLWRRVYSVHLFQDANSCFYILRIWDDSKIRLCCPFRYSWVSNWLALQPLQAYFIHSDKAMTNNHLLIYRRLVSSDYSVKLDILRHIMNADVLRPMSDVFKWGMNNFVVYGFPALHGKLSICPSSVRPFVGPSVWQTRGLWQSGRKICPDFYIIRKII